MMEASKCPKCGEEPSYLEHMEKWYCFECNSYMDEDIEDLDIDEEGLSEEAPEGGACTCEKCGAEQEDVPGTGPRCPVCDSVTKEGENEAQTLIDDNSDESESFISEALAEEAKPAVEHPVMPATKIEPTVRACPTCGRSLKWIDKYQRHYCYGCKKYAPKVQPEKAPPTPVASQVRSCPECGKELKLIEKYKEFYCYACKKYPFVKRKASPQTAQRKAEPEKCPRCGKTLSWIQKYERHYCYACRAYAPKAGASGVPNQPQKRTCPLCKGSMKFVTEYNEWYCYTCRKYSLRPNKPVLLF